MTYSTLEDPRGIPKNKEPTNFIKRHLQTKNLSSRKIKTEPEDQKQKQNVKKEVVIFMIIL